MYNQNESDETLVLLTLAGEQSAYETLVRRYQRAVVSSAAYVTKSSFLAEDAAQDAFVTAWMKLNTLQNPQKYGPWVCRIARNCAINMIARYRSYLPFEILENVAIDDPSQNTADLAERSEERDEVNQSVEKLPEKVRQIICLHYYENLSVAEIADRLRVSEGTVKWQLHDGRKRIRKDLCAMNEKYTDTLAERVMKKVEELKLWQVRNDKTGFETVYRDVLREVEELPECFKKNHALADVLMRGWWWIPGKKNDALFARITDAAIKSKNEEVMTFIVAREDSRVSGGAKIDFVREKQIPRLEKEGFVSTLGREWFWLGRMLCDAEKPEEGLAAFNKAEEILPLGDPYRALVPLARTTEKVTSALKERGIAKEHYRVEATADEYRIIDGMPRFWSKNGIVTGYLRSINLSGYHLFRNASCCDGLFFIDLPVGDSFVGSDGTKLTFLSDRESVDTPAEKFENCQLWEARRWTEKHKIVCRTYFKEGVGIVRQEYTADGATDIHTLRSYQIREGSGFLPFYPGNSWEYVSGYPADVVSSELTFTVSFADEGLVILSGLENAERLRYDENSWQEAVQEIASDYRREINGISRICDVSSAIGRAERLAETPMEKAYTRAAASVARRILATDTALNPEYTATGHWNFFERFYVRQKEGLLISTEYDPRWCFEWINTSNMGQADKPIYYNDVLGILQDAANCLWSDEWHAGAAPIVEYTKRSRTVRTQIICEDSGTVATQAGTFANCIKLCFDIEGMDGGWSYRGGKKVYYFAEGVGIIRTENEYCDGAGVAVYELTSYTGTGKGFMPVGDGFMRRYDALNLTDGFEASVEYTFVADGDGDIVVFADRTGVRVLPPPITEYGAIQREMAESELGKARKWKEARMKHAENNFHLLLHFLARPTWNRGQAKRSIDLNGYRLMMIEHLGRDGGVPPAWQRLYSRLAFVRAAAFFGNGQTEEGYSSLDLALDYCEKSASFRAGDLLDTGNEGILGGVKYEFAKGVIRLPDGSREMISYDNMMNWNASVIVYCMTALHGWEWFNRVRNEDRFRERIERARKISEKNT